MAINKEKSINYVLSGVVFIIAVVIVSKLALNLWQFDIFNLKHYKAFGRFIANGRFFKSPKYISFVMVMIGSCLITYFSVLQSLDFDLSKFVKTPEQKNEDAEVVPAKVEEKEVAPVAQQKAMEDEKNSQYAMYNTPSKVKEVEVVNEKQVVPNAPVKEEVVPVKENVDEEKERERLQSKIREVMERLKNKSLNQDDNEDEVKEEVPSVVPEEQKILTPMQFDELKKSSEMNFKNISQEQNTNIEETFISAGFKLLSEIRIGKTGIDYLAVSKSEIAILQLDTKDGNWMASEDKIGDELPVWFSEEERKYSPVARAVEAKNTIAELINGKVDLPIKAYACLANSGVMNYFDIENSWKNLGVDVIRLSSNKTIDDIDTLEETFPISSQEEVDEETMNTLIEILEKAELPE